MRHEIRCTWIENMAFDTAVNGHTIRLDVDESMGGDDTGPRPKPLILSALAGCTGVDVIMILKKMRIEPTYFNITAAGNLSESEPQYYETIHLTYEFSEEDRQHEKKIERAVALSHEKYCGVTAQLRVNATITDEIKFLEG